jgi:putative ABC transport system permease protein
MYLLRIAFRNIRKNGRRSLFTILAISCGFSAVNLFSGYIHNVYNGLQDQAVRGEGLGHLTIAKKGYFQSGTLNPEKYLFTSEELSRIQNVLEKEPAVRVWAPRLALSGIITNGKSSTVFIAEGVEPEREAKIRGDYRPDRGGMLDPLHAAGIAVSSDLAQMLNLSAGSSAVLLTTTFEGQFNALDADVARLYNTGISATNDKSLIMPLPFAQRIMDTEGADRVRVLLFDTDLLESVQATLRKRFIDAGLEVDIRAWHELSTFYRQVKGLFDVIFAFIFAIVLVVVAMSVINTMSMAVMERTREIGTLRALGMKRQQLVRLFSAEALLLAVFGTAVGLIVTVIVGQGVNMAGITYAPPNTSDSVPLMVDFVYGRFALAFLSLCVLTVAAAFIPSSVAARMPAVDALGHV